MKKTTGLSRLLAMAALALGVVCTGTATAQVPAGLQRITLLTGAPGGSWYAYSAGIAQILTEAGVSTTPEQGGGNSNVMNIAAGNAEVGFALTTANYMAKTGQGAFKQPVTGVMGLAVLFPQVAHTAVTVESGVTSYAQLKGQRMASQSMATGSRQIFEDTLKAYGLAGESDLDIVVRGGPGVGSQAVRDRQAMGMIATTNPPTAAFSELSATIPIRLLPIDDAAYEILRKSNPGYGRGVIPAGSYPGIDADVPTISDDTILIVPASLPEEHAYWLVKTLAENAKAISRIGPALRQFSPKSMPGVMVLDLHPGARRYYQEAGLLR